MLGQVMVTWPCSSLPSSPTTSVTAAWHNLWHLVLRLPSSCRAWGSTCSDPWNPVWPGSLLAKNILAQMLSSAALAWPGTAQTLQSGVSFLTWLLPKPFHNFCRVFLPHTPSSSCFSIFLLLPPLGLQHSSLAALADVRKGLRQSKNTIKTTQLPLPAHVPALGFFPLPFVSSFFSAQVPYTHMWLPDWLSLSGHVIHVGPMPPPPPDTPVCCPLGRLSMGRVGLCHLPA